MNALPAGTLVPALSAERPFPGLRPFSASDHEYFFGRKAQFFALYRLLDQSRFVAVVGSSGSGKSSLVRAGLLPLLRHETQDSGGRNWFWQEMRPGNAPIEALAEALTNLGRAASPGEEEDIRKGREGRLAHNLESEYGIARSIGDIEGLKGTSVVLVIDQFEELFRSVNPGNARRDPRDEIRTRDDAERFVQLLLEASRSPDRDIRILITMRSDFIGDCARFQGLPEIVSTAQFLVPSLTEDQREMVITGPIEQAGASIDAALVQHLLNDSNNELDQLPVLQHCLFRLWEQTAPGDRHLTLDHYRAVGGVTHALSQHANEILKSLPVPEFAVEQTFRALSDLHDESRITRRVCSFEQLVAETGVADEDLRKVIMRLQADDCSFLAPVPRLTAKARIDVGHEALLRRWERVSGEAEATGETGDQRPLGWLRKEVKDGQIYRALRSFSEGEGETIHGELFEHRWKWWNRPEGVRTRAWAERYGGGYDQVVRLLKNSEAEVRANKERRAAEQDKERRNAKKIKIVAVLVSGLLVVAVAAAGFAFKFFLDAQTATDDSQKTLSIALDQTMRLGKSASDSFNSGLISTTAALDLAAVAQQSIDDLMAGRQGRGNQSVQIAALNMMSDIYEAVGNRPKSLESVRKAKALASAMMKAKAAGAPKMLYESLFREADITETNSDNLPIILEGYRGAKTLAEGLLKEKPEDGQAEYDLAFVSNKVGETLQILKKFNEAQAEFQTALAHAEKAATRSSTNAEWLALPAATLTKIGLLYTEMPPQDLRRAILNFDRAMSLQESLRNSLAQKHIKHDVVSSNFGSSHRHKANTLVKLGNLDEAVNEYQAAIGVYKKLHNSDPVNSGWLTSLGKVYSDLGDMLSGRSDFAGAKCARISEKEIRETLVNRYPDNFDWRRSLRSAEAKLDAALLAAPSLVSECPEWRFRS